jgi:ATP-dependent Clp protease ATP-binding subunit ClpC
MDDDSYYDNDYTVTPAARSVLQKATVLAIQLNQRYVTSEHILYCLLEIKSKQDMAIRVLKKLRVPLDTFRELVIENIKQLTSNKEPPVVSRYRKADQVYYSPKVKEIISISGAEAMSMGTSEIGTEHLLIGIMMSDTGIATSVFKQANIDATQLRDMIYDLSNVNMPKKKKSRSRKTSSSNTESQSEFEKYATDLTLIAESGDLLPVIGRSQEIDQVIQTLLRKSKNNPVIIGEPGVGKTAIVEGLALRIVNGDVPKQLQHKRIMTLDMPLMVAGTKYRGQFEERLTAIIKEVKDRDDIILFVDEMHMMVGAGDADGAMDASNIMKPSLSRGELTIIGATTTTEYTKFIEKDGALERRFQQIQVNEPDVASTTQILYGVKRSFEQYHNVTIDNTCVDRVVHLCARYITDRNFPDKAIDVMDETCAYIRLKQYRKYTGLDEQVKQATEQKEQHVQSGDFEKACEWREIESQEKKRAAKRAKQYERASERTINMTMGDVERVVARNTGVPINSIKHGDREKVKRLQSYMHRHVIGQDHAVETIVTSIKRSYTGLSGQQRPIGCFLFLGPTGVGKTHLTKCLTEYLFDNADNMIRVDMSELMESHSVSKLIGSPPGYVGYEEANQGQLTERVRRNPYSVVLFDEIEKAHPDVMNLMLQMLDEGMLTDSHGRKINFKNTIIVLTSNIGAREIQRNTTVGFSRNDTESSDRVLREAQTMLPPEFINRLDEIVMFNQLDKPDMRTICDMLFRELTSRLQHNNITFTCTPRVKQHIVDLNTEHKYGARPLRRLISKHVENAIADHLLSHHVTRIHATCQRGRIMITSPDDPI